MKGGVLNPPKPSQTLTIPVKTFTEIPVQRMAMKKYILREWSVTGPPIFTVF